MVEASRRSGETIIAMGMARSLAQRWARVNNRYMAAVARLSEVASSSKALRLLLQSVILGLGAYLVISTCSSRCGSRLREHLESADRTRNRIAPSHRSQGLLPASTQELTL
jgi:hypothetical protein